MPGCENDKAAFKLFNRIRNGLLHRGDPNVKIHVPVGEEIQALEDLTERYVNFYLFGDTTVYQSSFVCVQTESAYRIVYSFLLCRDSGT